ncbi:hypothetical protein SK128_014071, partial [Halocaridina rubra]
MDKLLLDEVLTDNTPYLEMLEALSKDVTALESAISKISKDDVNRPFMHVRDGPYNITSSLPLPVQNDIKGK